MRRRTRAVVTGAVAWLALAACATVPTSGPIEVGAPVGGAERPPAPVALVSPPADGATPEEVVSGFLTANAVPNDDYAVARTFLSPEVQESWNPEAGAIVYSDGPGFSLDDSAAPRVRLRANEAGRLSADGRYQVSDPGRRLDQTFVLRQISGQWRILELRDGLFLTERDIARVYDGFDVYFLDPSGSVLVPDRLLIVRDRPGVGTTIVRRLLEGAGRWLAPAVVSAFPVGTELAIDATPVDDGVMTVELNDVVLQADAAARQQLAAQLVWSLTALPGVDAVRITVSGQPLPIEGQGTVLVRGGFASYDPDVLPKGVPGYLVVDGVLISIGADGTPVTGVFGQGAVEPVRVGVDLTSSRAAAEVAGAPLAGRVFIAGLQDGSQPVQRTELTSVGSLSFTRDGTLFALDDRVGAIRSLPPGGGAQGVPVQAEGRPVRLAMARDGTRVALVLRGGDPAEDVLVVARVVRRAGVLRFEAPRRIESTLQRVVDVAWGDADRLVVVAQTATGGRQVHDVVVGGIAAIERGGVPGMVAVAAAPGSPVLVQADGGIWENAGSGWRRIGAGTAPAYPG
jgi:hypothetical protein